MQLALCNHSQR